MEDGVFYKEELDLLLKVLAKSGIVATVAHKDTPIASLIGGELTTLFYEGDFPDVKIGDLLSLDSDRTIYRMSDRIGFFYQFFSLVLTDSVLFFGPYTDRPLSQRDVLERAEKAGVQIKNPSLIESYCDGIPTVPESSAIFTLVGAFLEKMWKSGSLKFVDVGASYGEPISVLAEKTHTGAEDLAINMKIMERRYKYENELMDAVSAGQIQALPRLLAAFSDLNFEKRVADPVRNTKNYCIIMNTLLRKAAEKGGVHPLYIDRISSGYAARIEQSVKSAELEELMREMFTGYCKLVQKHSLKGYSPIIQKTLIYIDTDLSADLSLSALAEMNKVSGVYLSTLFKKETGKNLTTYIRDKRIKRALYLLDTTKLQIQTVASHCGIMDVQYFSKIFKKQVGKTPKEYRESKTGQNK